MHQNHWNDGLERPNMLILSFTENISYWWEWLEVDAKMETYVIVFAIVGSHISLKVLITELLFRRGKDKIYKNVLHQSVNK